MFALLFFGCDLITPEEEEAGIEALDEIIESGTVVGGAPSGAWQSTDAVVNDLLIFEDNILYIFKYEPSALVIEIDTILFTLTSTDDAFIVEMEPNEIDTVPFTFSEDTLIVTTEEDKTEKFVPFSSESLPIHWIEKSTGEITDTPEDTVDSVDKITDSVDKIIDTVIAIDTGSFVNGLPLGSWQINETPMNEISMISEEYIVFYDYDSEYSSLWIDTIPYSVNDTKTAFLVEGKEGEVQTVPFTYADGILTIIEPDHDDEPGETVEYIPYSGTELPETWEIKVIEEEGLYDGQWISGDSTFVLQMWGDSLFDMSYDASTKHTEWNGSKFEVNASADTLFVSNKGEVFTLAVIDYTGETLTIESPEGEIVKLTAFYGDVMDIWDMEYTGGSPLQKMWVILTDEETIPDEILIIKGTSIEEFFYDIETEKVEMGSTEYWIDSLQNLTMKLKDGTEERYTFSIWEDTLVLSTGNEKIIYVEYWGEIPHPEWAGEFYERPIDEDSDEHTPIGGQWIVDNGEYTEVWWISNEIIEMVTYNESDSSRYYEKHTFSLSADGQTVYIHFEDHKAEFSVSQTDETLVLTDSEKTLKFIRDDNFYPDKEWITEDKYDDDQYVDDKYGDDQYDDDQYGDDKYGDDKYGDDQYGEDQYGEDQFGEDQFGDDHKAVTEPYFGQWENGNEVYAIGPRVISIFTYDEQTGTLMLEQLPYKKDNDKLLTISADGVSNGYYSFAVSGNELSLKDQNGGEVVLSQYEGSIPTSTWNITSNEYAHLTDHQYIGSWLSTDGDLNEIVTFGPTLITISKLEDDNSISTEYHDYYIDATGNNIIIIDGPDGNERKMAIVLEGNKIEVSKDNETDSQKGVMTFSKYDGSIPHPDWM